MTEADLIYETPDHRFTVRRTPTGYGLYREESTHAVLVGRYGRDDRFLHLAIQHANERARINPHLS